MLHTPTQADIVEAFHVRMMIEGYCANVVARNYQDAAARAAIESMEDALRQQRSLLEDDSAYSLSQFWLDDITFHRAPMEYVNVSSLISQYESFMYVFMPHHLIRQFDVRQKQPRALERHRSTLIEHAAITEALKSRDEARALAAVRAHLDSSLRALYVPVED